MKFLLWRLVVIHNGPGVHAGEVFDKGWAVEGLVVAGHNEYLHSVESKWMRAQRRICKNEDCDGCRENNDKAERNLEKRLVPIIEAINLVRMIPIVFRQ